MNNLSSVSGITWDSRKNKWICRLHYKGKRIYLGSFQEENDAINVLNKNKSERGINIQDIDIVKCYENEFFIDIKGFEEFYKVSNFGRFMSFHKNNQKILKQYKNKQGYLMVKLFNNKENKTISSASHVIIAENFLGFIRNGKQDLIVDHIDRNNNNNHISNLQITTQRINCIKDRKKENLGASLHNSGKWLSRIYINGKTLTLGYFSTKKEANETYLKELNKI